MTNKRFDDIVGRGIEENPTSLNPEKKGKRGVSPKTKARNLLYRFLEYKEKIFRFLTDLRGRFEKIKQKRSHDDEVTAENTRNFPNYKRSGNFLQN